jgi:hypothetical protein
MGTAHGVPHYGQFACCRIKIEKKKMAMTKQKASLKSTQGAFKASQSTHK